MPERFWEKVEKCGPVPAGRPDLGSCWLWRGRLNTDGYGTFKVDGGRFGAHRFAYELVVSKIPEGLQIDHLCRVRHCVNPAHLEPVTSRENSLRRTRLLTACKYGHPLVQGTSQRFCPTCKLERNRARRRSLRSV